MRDTIAVAMLSGGLLLAPVPPIVAAQEPPELPALLASAGAYLDGFARQVGGVVVEEDYVQQVRVRQITSRHLRSDLTVLADMEEGLVEFRDVFEVDGKAVRDREDRLARLFASGLSDARAQARAIANESARFNLNAEGLQVDRTLNLPMAAVAFLRTANQQRSAFRLDGHAAVDGRRVRVVRFKETAQPRLIGSLSGSAAEGTFWVDAATGVVTRTELVLTSSRGTTDATATVLVSYAPDPEVGLWLPREMEEHYTIRGTGVLRGSIDGHATYSNVRRFGVAVEEQPNPVPR